MRGMIRLAILPALALTTSLIGAAQQLLTPPSEGWVTNGGTLLGKLDAEQIRAVTTTDRNNMPTLREIYDVKQLRDVSGFIVQGLGKQAN